MSPVQYCIHFKHIKISVYADFIGCDKIIIRFSLFWFRCSFYLTEIPSLLSGGFLSEGGWYDDAEDVLANSYKFCNTREPEDCKIATKFLTRYWMFHQAIFGNYYYYYYYYYNSWCKHRTSWCKSRGKRKGKVEKYQDLKREIGRAFKLEMVEVVPVAIRALGSVTKGFDRWIEKLGIPLYARVMQKTALLERARFCNQSTSANI